MSTFRFADDDLGQSKQAALTPIFKRIAPTLVRPFQKGMKSVPSATRKKALKTYFKDVKLQGDPASKKNTRLLRDILVKALIRDRGWLEFVAEQILDGSPEIADILAPATTASMRTAGSVDAIFEGNYPTAADLHGVDFPVSFDLMGQSDSWHRLAGVASAEGVVDGSTVTLNSEEEAADLFAALLDEARDNEAECERQLYEDYISEADEGVSEEEWLDENHSEYCSDVHDPAYILAQQLGL